MTATTTATAPVSPDGEDAQSQLHWSDRQRDKYGRSFVTLDRVWVAASGHWVARDRHLATVVTLPKTWVQANGTRYLLSVARTPAEWAAEQAAAAAEGRAPMTRKVSYHVTRRAALVLAERAAAGMPRPA
jgi:hypothetical protein